MIESVISVVQDVSCHFSNQGFFNNNASSNGMASITSSGGVSSYTYYWSNGYTGFSTPDTAYGLSFGSYYVTTRDALGCEVVDSVYISQPEPLYVNAREIEAISCYGANDGLAIAHAWGGTKWGSPYILTDPNYNYSWSNLSSSIPVTNGYSVDTVNTLPPGIMK